MSLADRGTERDQFGREHRLAEIGEEPARWPPCVRCGIQEAKPGVWCPHQLAAARCPWVLDADGRIAQP